MLCFGNGGVGGGGGSSVLSGTFDERYALSPTNGQQFYDTDLKMHLYFDGTIWREYTNVGCVVYHRVWPTNVPGPTHDGCSGGDNGGGSAQSHDNMRWSRHSSTSGGPRITSANGSAQFYTQKGIRISRQLSFEDASYNQTGPSTGCRIFSGLVTASGNWFTSDNPAGSRIGMVRIHTDSGLQDTNFFISAKDGTTENRIDTGMAFVVSEPIIFEIWIPPGGAKARWIIKNLATSTIAQGTVTANLPAATTALYDDVCLISLVDAVSRSFDYNFSECKSINMSA